MSSESEEEEEEEDVTILKNMFFDFTIESYSWSNKLYHYLVFSCFLPFYKNHKQ